MVLVVLENTGNSGVKFDLVTKTKTGVYIEYSHKSKRRSIVLEKENISKSLEHFRKNLECEKLKPSKKLLEKLESILKYA